MPILNEIRIYPIKALNSVSVPSCKITKGGALENDRRFMFVDAAGNRINGKRSDKVILVHADYNFADLTVQLSFPNGKISGWLHLHDDVQAIEAFMADWLGYPVTLKEDIAKGFPDDAEADGPTIVSEASIAEVASWYPGMTATEVKRRFRCNLFVAETEPFWEDYLFGKADEEKKFSIGDVDFVGINPCQRCIVPTRNSETGERDADFQQHFMEKREQSLSAKTERSRFNHFYRFTTNTRVAQSGRGKTIRVADVVNIPDC